MNVLRLMLAVALAAALAAQAGPGRKPTFARVVDLDGQPVAGAEVTFAGSNPHLSGQVLPADVQVVVSDRRGRARARLLSGLSYVAWAVGPARAEVVASDAVGYFGAGAMLELICRADSYQRIDLAGAASWDELGPLRYYAVTPHPGIELELEPEADGSLVVPPLPGVAFEVRTAAGEPLWAAPNLNVERLPPPWPVPVRVVDPDGEPIAGARIRHRVTQRPSWRIDGVGGLAVPRMRQLGVTDADGRATVSVPYDGNPLVDPRGGWMMLHVDAPGRAVVAGGNNGRHVYVDDRRVEKLPGEELVFTLPAVEPLEVPAGRLPPQTAGQLVAVCKLWSRGNSYMHDTRVFHGTAAADGEMSFDNVPVDVHSLRLALLLPDGGVPCAFEGLSGRSLPPELTGERGARLFDRVARLELRVIDVTGGPARGAVACAVPSRARGVLQRDSMFRFPLDSAGRGEVLLGPGQWVAIVITDTGYAATEIVLPAGEHEAELRLEPLATMQIVLRDKNGKPVPGARVRSAGSRTTSTADPLQNVLRLFARHMYRQWNQLETDRDGALTLPFLPVDSVTWSVSLTWTGGSTDKFVVEATDVPIDLSPK